MKNNNDAARKPSQTVVMKDISIPYNTETWKPRNFSGLERVSDGRVVNSAGQRNFCVFLDPKQVDCEQMIEDGWNIQKRENPKDPQAEPSYMLRVKVRYHKEGTDLARLNPKVRVCTSTGTMDMDENNISDIDSAQIIKANITIHGTWQVTPGYTGYVAYLSKLVLRVYEEEGGMDELMEGIMD